MIKSTTRALLVTPLVPLVGVAGVAFCAHVKDQDVVTSLGAALGFALVWAIFIYPIGLVGGLGAHCLLSALKRTGKRYYFAAWFLGGAVLVGAWFGAALGLRWGLGFGFVGGLVNGIAGLTFSKLAFVKV